jgi:hypothetical protein
MNLSLLFLIRIPCCGELFSDSAPSLSPPTTLIPVNNHSKNMINTWDDFWPQQTIPILPQTETISMSYEVILEFESIISLQRNV